MQSFRAAIAGLLILVAVQARADDWPYYGRDAEGTRFSPLRQITPANVAHLLPVWQFHTGDVARGANGTIRSGFESTPLLIGGRLYVTTPFNRIIALNPATGTQEWAFDPRIDRTQPYGDGLINRGVAAWKLPGASGVCALRLYEATLDARLIAIDGRSGLPCDDFGTRGEVDLRDVSNYRPGWYHMTSPPIVVDGVVVVGSAIDDNARAEMPSGVVRGYDARSGKLLWKWDPLVPPRPDPDHPWLTGAGNAWSVMSADPRHHLVYIPTGSASPDYYGGLRRGDDRWADSVVAISPRSGGFIWGFQLVHHNLWDYDTAAPPLVTSFRLHGQTVPVLFAGNKSAMIYALDPLSGKPVLPIEERAVPASDVPGELSAPTQPFPSSIPPLARQSLTPEEAWGPTPEDRVACARILKSYSGQSLFDPPSLQGALAIPGALGGINWSGFTWDRRHQWLIVAVSNLPFEVRLIPRDQVDNGQYRDFRAAVAPQAGTTYAMARKPLLGPSGLPCSPPPWGEIVAVEPASGKIIWRHPLGTMEDVFHESAKAIDGSVILGGPIVTASGLIFVGGSMDHRLHALSVESGRELWSATLPTSAHAQPVTYEVAGRQYVVIAAGGSAKIDEETQDDVLAAFALPDGKPH